ncbi:MAG: hypothetical protein RLZZ296_61, partial [Pseudomonadota bacterium]
MNILNFSKLNTRTFGMGVVALVLAVLQGCAMSPNANPRDPWE